MSTTVTMSARMSRAWVAACLAVALAGCRGDAGDQTAQRSQELELSAAEPARMVDDEWALDGDDAPAREEARAGRARRAGVPGSPAADMKKEAPLGGLADGGGGGGERGPATRSWFPETFLFEPLVVTSEAGQAEVAVRVPDRLTTWRVLALAHSRGGAQAGGLATFVGTLPVYVDPVVPPRLRVGDELRLPIQLVNTTSARVDAALVVEAAGGLLSGASGAVTVDAQGSVLRQATLRATAPGTIRIMARLGEADAVVRAVEVVPLGRPVTQRASGTLARPRTLTTAGAAGADSAAGRARLLVLPGAMAMVRAELAAVRHGSGEDLAGAAYDLFLAGRSPALLHALGDEPDLDELRHVTLLAAQRAVRHGRVLDTASATLLAQGALAHPADPVLARLGRRAVEHIEQHQVPDGTCGGETGWTLQRLLVSTAGCVRAAADAPAVKLRASGAFERHAARIEDAYTAAAVLASGAAQSELAGRLRALVRGALVERPDGSWVLPVPAGVLRADGARPNEAEATAMAVLALLHDADAPLADMGAALLSSYVPGVGWGDGHANLVCLEAAMAVLRAPLPDTVTITLLRDGEPVAQGVLDRARRREVLALEAPADAGASTWEVKAEPPVPGLGFSLAVTHFVPWQRAETPGLELTVTPPATATVGETAEVIVRAAAPGGAAPRIEIPLPAGVQVDSAGLDELVSQGVLSRHAISDDAVTLWAAPLQPAQVLSARIRVVATLAGTLHGGAALMSVGDDPGHQAHALPARWIIRERGR